GRPRQPRTPVADDDRPLQPGGPSVLFVVLPAGSIHSAKTDRRFSDTRVTDAMPFIPMQNAHFGARSIVLSMLPVAGHRCEQGPLVNGLERFLPRWVWGRTGDSPLHPTVSPGSASAISD